MSSSKVIFRQIWLEVMKANLRDMMIFSLVIVAVVIAVVYSGNLPDWWQKTDRFALLMDTTLIAALFIVGFKQYRQNWEASLENYLTVEYQYQDRTQIKVEFIPLSSLGDLRAQAQSVIQALNNGRADLYPMMKSINHGNITRLTDADGKTQIVELHTAVISLEKPINEQTGEHDKPGLSQYGIDTATEYLYWPPPFNKNVICAINRHTGESRKIQLPTA